MATGGFNGTYPSPTLAEFERDVAAHEIHYFIGVPVPVPVVPVVAVSVAVGRRRRQQTSSTATVITSWVTSHFTAKTVGGVTVYDLTSPTPRSDETAG